MMILFKNNKFTIIIVACIICIGMIVLALSNRFYIDTSTGFKVDRLTGKTYQLVDGMWDAVENKSNKTIKVTTETIIESTFYDESLDISLVWIEYQFFLGKLYSSDKYNYFEAMGDEYANTIKVKNISSDYIIQNIVLVVKLLKDDAVFYSKKISIDKSINPKCSIEEHFHLETSMEYPERPWTYSIEILEATGSLME
jgi:hypothetical protein